jgi:hypothetical protein
MPQSPDGNLGSANEFRTLDPMNHSIYANPSPETQQHLLSNNAGPGENAARVQEPRPNHGPDQHDHIARRNQQGPNPQNATNIM